MLKKNGFTLIELIIVIIIVGILASIGLTQYNKVVEKSRAAEARMILGTLRSAEFAEYNENGSYVTVGSLGVGAPSSCVSTHYFTYTCATNGTCTATRCTTGGKPTQGTTAWTKSLTIDGTWGGTPGY
ncbi:MAG: prepilin-type N-terminal cleavage/methylation domain-containing protein [Candidatus Omnitrophica bacterium]|jgi:prepilin-type N-terminal cleavage/methylation domain-containing protein|nr:prepilin-type N-terminal cleavage/methylation domain-containing protein [Candidatus Omnitrophota bacterium]MDD3274950.1 prepilin-type N-terminal cleavage/methylation domain-containing protein [Candidatus Omnitrophota bacterium]MDD5078476.1 prepilin-type N-terminal cleavage/methylation domain-containing protein [Candidatus Omnitrophota bacterium]MDD5724905.1 prepilin-type N-terminal cleavage/methylation domain-containing protein [Candidatus Omnitrophota bacterium]